MKFFIPKADSSESEQRVYDAIKLHLGVDFSERPETPIEPTFIVNNFCSLIQEKLYQDAIVYIQKAIEMFPEDDTGFGYYSLGFCYLQLKDYQSVIYNCTKAININPKLGLAYFLRGQAYFLPYYNKFIYDEDKI